MAQSKAPEGSIRKLWPTDLPQFREHLLRLDAESRRSRFAMGASDEFLRRYAERSFALDAVIFGYFEGAALRAAAELRGMGRREAEAAFSVEPECRRQGVGTALFARLVTTARNRNLRRIYMSCLAGNRAMQTLARKFEADLVFEADDVLGVVQAERPSPTSLVGEAVADMGGFATAVLALPGRWFLR